MPSTALFIEAEFVQRFKQGEDICGDSYRLRRDDEDGRFIAVLSDGLGSGVKANVLSSMTTSMAITFIASEMDLLRSAEIMMDALPVCRERRIAYATFAIVDIRGDRRTRIIEMDTPQTLVLRRGRSLSIAYQELRSPRHHERTIRVAELTLEPEDRIVLYTDGLTQAGLGSLDLPLGWRDSGCRILAEEVVERQPQISACQLSRRLVSEALHREPRHAPGDDMSCGVLYLRSPRFLTVLSGPPYHRHHDGIVGTQLGEAKGKKVICGGTTAEIVSRELGLPLTTDLATRVGDIPPLARMEGIDLVTEGILTLSRACELIDQGREPTGRDAVSSLVRLLLESDRIEFIVGTRLNDAHQDPSLPPGLEIRRTVIQRLAALLEKRHLKQVTLRFV